MATQLQGTGLFGMPTVQEARERYRQQSTLSPAQTASQGLLQRLASVISQGGASAGEGIGRLLGGKAPGEAEALGMEQAMREVMASGETDPAKRMLALADALQQRGLSRAAMAALEKGRAMQTEDIQRRAAEGRLKQLTPIYGPTETTIDKETLRPVSTKPIIGYIDGEGKRYSVEQAKSLFPGQVVDETVPPPKAEAKDAVSILKGNVQRGASKTTTEQQARVEEAKELPADPEEALIAPKPLTAPADLVDFQEPGAFSLKGYTQQKKVTAKEVKPGVDYKVVTPKSNDPSEIRRATRQTKLNELKAKFKKARTKAEREVIRNEARVLGLTFGVKGGKTDLR